MGRQNVLQTYMLYAGKVPPLSMQLLAYMAAVSTDKDKEPWFGMGHAALASIALGRKSPIEREDIKAVERAITPLRVEGAITTLVAAYGNGGGQRTVRYRLWVNEPAPPEMRGMQKKASVPRKTGDEQIQRPPENGLSVPRKTAQRPPENGLPSPENRGTNKKDQYGPRQDEEVVDVRTDVTARARARRKAFFGFGIPIGDPAELDPEHEEEVA